MKLPPAQKAAVLAVVLAVIGVGLYFLLIDPELARADQARGNLKRLDGEIAQLNTEFTPEEQERLRKLKDELIEKDKENRKMLPGAEEVPDFIEAVQTDAKDVGLSVKRFDRLPEESEDMYVSIPIKMTVEGSMLELVRFLRIYAGNERRVINLRDLAIEQVPPDEAALKAAVQAAKPLEVEKTAAGQPIAKSPEQVMLEKIELMEESRKQSRVRATFTAYAFTWTGKPAEQKEGGGPRPQKAKKKRT